MAVMVAKCGWMVAGWPVGSGAQVQVFGPFGGVGGESWVSSVPGCALAYLSRAAHKRVDSLTLHWECP